MNSIGAQIENGSDGPEWQNQRLPEAAQIKELFDRLQRSERGHIEVNPMMKTDVAAYPRGEYRLSNSAANPFETK